LWAIGVSKNSQPNFYIEGVSLPTPLQLLLVTHSAAETAQLRALLQAEGYEPTIDCVAHPAALQVALEQRHWELVLVTYPLDGFYGFDAINFVRAKRLDLPCIVVSRISQPDVIVAAMQVGAHDFIVPESHSRTVTLGEVSQASSLATHYPRLVPAIKRELREAETRRVRQQVAFATRRQAASADALVRIAARLNAPLDLPSVIQAVCEETAHTLQVPAAHVMLYDVQRESLYVAGSYGLPEGTNTRFKPIPRALYNEYARRQGPLIVVPDLQAEIGLPNAALYAELNGRTTASASMVREGELVGLLTVLTFGATREFTAQELNLLKGLADLAAQAISHARLFEQANRRLEQMQALRAIDVAIISSLDLRLTLNILLEQIRTQLQVHAVEVLLLNPHTHLLEHGAVLGFNTRALQPPSLRLGQGLAGRAALERRMHRLAKLEGVLSSEPFNGWKDEGFKIQYAIPLIAKGQVKGVLNIFQRATLNPDAEWLDFMEALAGQAAIAIDNATLFENLQRSNLELLLAYDATIEGWSRALDLRDKETEGHSQRVTELALTLARLLGLNEDELIHMRRGTLLHDIGKMGVPDNILLKPGPLDEE
jgi:GAF domain-containing protein